MMHPCSVCGIPDEEHPSGMCCPDCSCTLDPYAVDNASLGTREDEHPCGGGGINGSHAFSDDGRCEDCGWQCDHEDVDDMGRCACGVTFALSWEPDTVAEALGDK